MKLIFDTETTGIALFNQPPSDHRQPRMCQLGMIVLDNDNNIVHEVGVVIKPEGYEIPDNVAAIHGITQDYAMKYGIPISAALGLFMAFALQCKVMIGHNIKFDKIILESEFYRYFGTTGVDAPDCFAEKEEYCTMLNSTSICRIPNTNRGGLKWPKLSEAYKYFFNETLVDAHDALGDVRATMRIYKHLHSPLKKGLQPATVVPFRQEGPKPNSGYVSSEISDFNKYSS